MNSYPRQAKEIESLTSQLSTVQATSTARGVVLALQREEIMKLREQVVLLEQRPTREKFDALVEERDRWEDAANHFCTELEIARVQATPPKKDRRSVGSQMREVHDLMFGRACDCPMCEARGM